MNFWKNKPEIKNNADLAIIIETFRAVWKKNFVNAFNGLKKASEHFEKIPNILVLIQLLNESLLAALKSHLVKNFSSFTVADLKKMTSLRFFL